MQSRQSRVVRGGIAGWFATGVAASSHALAGGAAPSALALGVALVFAGMLGAFVIGRRPSLPRLTVVVAGSQTAFHLVFSTLTPGTASAGGHHGTATLLASAADHGIDPAMWLAHGLAAVATVVFLRRAELALFELIRDAVLDTVGSVRRLPAIASPPTVHRAWGTAVPRHPVISLLQFVVSHRGPPPAAIAL